MISPQDAWQRLSPWLNPLEAESRPRRRAAGRVLAQPVGATGDLPAHDVSAMDGYALSTLVGAGDSLPVVATVAAGDPPGAKLAGDQAARIMTGAPMPAGAIAVIPVESTDDGDETVRFHAGAVLGAHIRRHGEVVARGEIMLEAGQRLTPGALSLLAAHGVETVTVHRAPTVAFVSTGDEVVPPEAEPQPGQLRDSHSDFLLAAVSGIGCRVSPLGIAGDREASLTPLLERGFDFDVLLVSGGVSMGTYDVVGDVLADLGCDILFDKVGLQPGKPLLAARRGRGLIFGLPGNPASVMVCFWLFVRPVLRRLMGLRDGYWHGALAGELSAPLPGAKTRDRFLPAELDFADGRILVRPWPPKGSHDLVAYSRGNALVRVPAGASPAAAGDSCEVLPLVDWTSDRRQGD